LLETKLFKNFSHPNSLAGTWSCSNEFSLIRSVLNSERSVWSYCLFAHAEPWYFFFTKSQMSFDVSLQRIVSKIGRSIAWKRQFFALRSFKRNPSISVFCAFVISMPASGIGIPFDTTCQYSLDLKMFSISML